MRPATPLMTPRRPSLSLEPMASTAAAPFFASALPEDVGGADAASGGGEAALARGAEPVGRTRSSEGIGRSAPKGGGQQSNEKSAHERGKKSIDNGASGRVRTQKKLELMQAGVCHRAQPMPFPLSRISRQRGGHPRATRRNLTFCSSDAAFHGPRQTGNCPGINLSFSPQRWADFADES